MAFYGWIGPVVGVLLMIIIGTVSIYQCYKAGVCNKTKGFYCPRCKQFVLHQCSVNNRNLPTDGRYFLNVTEADIAAGKLKWCEHPYKHTVVPGFECPHCSKFVFHRHMLSGTMGVDGQVIHPNQEGLVVNPCDSTNPTVNATAPPSYKSAMLGKDDTCVPMTIHSAYTIENSGYSGGIDNDFSSGAFNSGGGGLDSGGCSSGGFDSGGGLDSGGCSSGGFDSGGGGGCSGGSGFD